MLDELHLVFGSCIDRLITPEDLVNLHYLECCIKESLRLYPTVPFIERFAREDIQVGKNKMTLQLDELLITPMAAFNGGIYLMNIHR